MSVFASQSELEAFAPQFIAPRLEALEKDTQHCLTRPFAPFPAVLLCFSTIAFLGALAAGNAGPGAPTSAQSEAYMQCFMNFTTDQAKLLQKLFRHKLVHLAQPKPVVAYSGKMVTWRYEHNDASQHLQLIKLPCPATQQIASGLSLTIDHEFVTSIAHLVKDVTESVRRPGGYLARLKIDPTLRGYFEMAISQIYAP
jgi:hypothetical protein